VPSIVRLLGIVVAALLAAGSPAVASEITVRFDYAAAEHLVAVLEKPEISDADIDGLIRDPGFAAVLRKTRIFVPEADEAQFRRDMRAFPADRQKRTAFGLRVAYANRAEVRALVRALRADERAIARRMIARVAPYAPPLGPVTVRIVFVAGGLSDGFVLEEDAAPTFYVALDRAGGDAVGVEQNMTHELYHALQNAAAKRVPAAAAFFRTAERAPELQRLLAFTWWEGTANFVADARETKGGGAYAAMWRDRYVAQLAPERLAESFALFDRTAVGLAARRLPWDDAYARGFGGADGARFYFVGLAMARALVSAHGADYVRTSFTRPPTEVFRDYAVLTRRDHSLPAFSAETTRILADLPPSW
jgi:hypothetical protein